MVERLDSSLNVELNEASSTEEEEEAKHDVAIARPASPRSKKLRHKAPMTAEALNDTTASQRLVEYFVIVSSHPRWKQQPERSQTPEPGARRKSEPVLGNIRIPVPPRSSPEYTFQPVITARFPSTDHADHSLNPMIVQFCYPTGDVIEPTTEYEMPRVHHFVLTQGSGRKLYATCLTVLEECNDPTVRAELAPVYTGAQCENGIEMSDHRGRSIPLYIPKVLCMLSAWPYLTAFREYLSQLYKLASTTNVMRAPLERYILNICCEIPAPPPGAYEIRISILDSVIRFWAPPAKLPIAYVALPYHILFECLDLDNLLTVWKALILEQKVLVVSSQYSILTVCSEILCSLLFPFRWSHLYVPLLPRMLSPMLDAPVPYLCGIVRENWMHAQQFISPESIVVDLDRNLVTFGPRVPEIPAAPPRKWCKLQAQLTQTVGDVFWRARGLEAEYEEMMELKPHKRSLGALRQKDTGAQQWIEKLSTMDHAFNLAYTPESPNLVDSLESTEQSKMDCVQETFLRFFVALLKDYRNYLTVPEKSDTHAGSNSRPSFDRISFIAGLNMQNAIFVSELCMTQQFDDFLTRRMYSPGEPDLKFFDQSIDAKLNRSKLKLKKVETLFLHSAKVHKELTKLDALPPNEEELESHLRKRPSGAFVYKILPETFDEGLFCEPRPIPKMISAEFDRQALLVSKLRSEITEDEYVEKDASEALDFYGGDFHPSPEVASFTVFLFVYSTLVGREWQNYVRKRRMEEAENGTDQFINCSPWVEREGVSGLEKISEQDESADGFGELSFAFCDTCAKDGVVLLKSTLSFIQASAFDTFNAFFHSPVERYAGFALLCSQDQSLVPRSDGAVAEYEEAREVAAAQLELAFEALATMSLRGLSVDSDAYLCLMEACGRCGNTKKALKLIEIMRKDGFVADDDVLSCFVEAFAHEDARLFCTDSDSDVSAVEESRAYSKLFQKDVDADRPTGGSSYHDTDESLSDEISTGSQLSTSRSSTGSLAFMDWIHRPPVEAKRKTRKRRRKRKLSGATSPVTDRISKHVELGESLLDFVYPNLVIDTSSDSCPDCSNSLTENDIVNGWKPCAFQDYTTQCPECKHRFVPRLVVTTTAPDFSGSQGPGTPLYCEFLSPWVLRKEFQYIIKGESGIEEILNPSWRSGTDIRATLFWNLIACCQRSRLPFTFLLQGSFKNRLVLPRQPDEL